MNIPKLGKGKHLALRANIKDGIILNNKGSYYLEGEKDFFVLIEGDKDEVIKFIQDQISSKPEIEWILYDGLGNYMNTFRKSQLNGTLPST